MDFKFTSENEKLAQDTIRKYPSERRFSAILPLLTIAQKQNNGYLTDEIILFLANYLSVSKMAIAEVVNFYSMYNTNPVGKYLIQTCNSIVCCIKGSDEIYKYAKEITDTTDKDVSLDGLFSVKKVECLGACVNAVVMKINDEFVENVDRATVEYCIASLKKNVFPKDKVNVKKPLTEVEKS